MARNSDSIIVRTITNVGLNGTHSIMGGKILSTFFAVPIDSICLKKDSHLCYTSALLYLEPLTVGGCLNAERNADRLLHVLM